MIHPSADRGATQDNLNQEALAQKIQERVTSVMNTPKVFDNVPGDRKTAALQKMFEREMMFAEKFNATLKKMLEASYSKILILFDIDETIAQNIYSESGDETVIRPALLPLLESIRHLIKTKKISIGFITTRSPGGIQKDLDTEKRLKPLKDYISPDAIFSTRDQPELGPNDDPIMIANEYPTNIPNSIIAADKISAEDPYEVDSWFRADNLHKINILQRLRNAHDEHTAFCAVDDIYYPEWLDEKKGMYGIRLKDREDSFTFEGL